MTTQSKALIVLAALCLLLAGLWWHERDGRLRAEGEAKVARVERQAAVDSARASEAARVDSVRAAGVREQVATAAAAAAGARADSAFRAARAAYARSSQVVEGAVAHEAPADTAVARRVAQEVADSIHANEVAPLLATHEADLQVHAADLVVQEGLRSQLSATDKARVDAQAALAKAITEIDALGRSRPGWTDKVMEGLKLVGAFAAGRASARLF